MNNNKNNQASFNKNSTEDLINNHKLIKENPDSLSTIIHETDRSCEVLYKNVNLLHKKKYSKNFVNTFTPRIDEENIINNAGIINYKSPDKTIINKTYIDDIRYNTPEKFTLIELNDDSYDNKKIKFIYYTNKKKNNKNMSR